VAATGAAPVLVDCERGGFNLSAEDAARKLTQRTRALVVCHLFGHPASLDDFLTLGVPVVEDCAQSVGARADGRLTGSRGRAAMTSFFATKVISTGQGGLVTGDDEVLANARDLVEYDGRDDWKPRMSCRMAELPASLGLWQLERLPRFLRRRAELAAFYDRELHGSESTPAPAMAGIVPIAYRYILRVPDADHAVAAFRARGVDAKRPVYRPLHHYLDGECPKAQRRHETLVSIPLYPTLTDGEAEAVVRAARAILF
jgi:dTDP-4-amino-4,6-dideoxygalactose transaminase